MTQSGEAEQALVPCTMRELVVYFLRLGTFGFGGPIALAGYMQKQLVDERRWVSRTDYLEGLALAAVYVHFGGLPWMRGAFYW